MEHRCKQIGIMCGDMWEKRFDQIRRVYSTDGISPTVTTFQGGGQEIKIMGTDGSVRKITPRESWRLMGFSDDDFDKAQAVNSNTQLYKQAGNSIVVNVLEAILRELLVRNYAGIK